MFEQDYIMRLIREMVRAILKLLFGIDTVDIPSSQLLKNTKDQKTVNKLLEKIRNGQINEAENKLYELIEDRTMDNLMIGLIFYSCLNEMDDDFLVTNDFNRDEVKEGVKYLATKYGLENMTEIFLFD